MDERNSLFLCGDCEKKINKEKETCLILVRPIYALCEIEGGYHTLLEEILKYDDKF